MKNTFLTLPPAKLWLWSLYMSQYKTRSIDRHDRVARPHAHMLKEMQIGGVTSNKY